MKKQDLYEKKLWEEKRREKEFKIIESEQNFIVDFLTKISLQKKV